MALFAEGPAEAARHRKARWATKACTRRMAADYPAYMAEFDQLLRLARSQQAPAALAAAHELALIDLAGGRPQATPRASRRWRRSLPA